MRVKKCFVSVRIGIWPRLDLTPRRSVAGTYRENGRQRSILSGTRRDNSRRLAPIGVLTSIGRAVAVGGAG